MPSEPPVTADHPRDSDRGSFSLDAIRQPRARANDGGGKEGGENRQRGGGVPSDPRKRCSLAPGTLRVNMRRSWTLVAAIALAASGEWFSISGEYLNRWSDDVPHINLSRDTNIVHRFSRYLILFLSQKREKLLFEFHSVCFTPIRPFHKCPSTSLRIPLLRASVSLSFGYCKHTIKWNISWNHEIMFPLYPKCFLIIIAISSFSASCN